MSVWNVLKRKLAAATAAALVTLGAVAPAHAIFGIGDIVFDPSNYAENVLSAARALTQIENQLKQLQNEALHLTGLDFSALERLRGVLASTQRLVDEAEGLAFRLDRVRDEFRRLYPEGYGEGASFEQMLTDALERWNYSRQALDTAMQLQAQASENAGEDEAMLADLIDRSQEAVGALQAAQATNQLLALQARQMIQTQQLALSQDRAVALEHGRVLAAEARARELRRRFMTQETRYTPETLQGFN